MGWSDWGAMYAFGGSNAVPFPIWRCANSPSTSPNFVDGIDIFQISKNSIHSDSEEDYSYIPRRFTKASASVTKPSTDFIKASILFSAPTNTDSADKRLRGRKTHSSETNEAVGLRQWRFHFLGVQSASRWKWLNRAISMVLLSTCLGGSRGQ
jgi:hypothetical protein